MNRIIEQILTESDNKTHCVARWAAVLSTFVGLGLSIYAVGWRGQAFDFQQFGMGVGTLFAGLGVVLKLKTESKNDSQ